MLANLWRQYGEVQFEASCLVQRRYPRFVTAHEPTLADDDVPVFVFHSIEPAEFEAQLRYLVENGYNTLTGDAFLSHLEGEKAPPRSVLLTIDDGRASVWTFGLPLLRKYALAAVVFLIPGYTRTSGEVGATLEEVWRGRMPAEDVRSRDPELMTWSEIEMAAASGRIDFQVHTLFHHRVPVGHRIVDYVNPAMGGPLFDLPIEPGQEETLLSQGIEAFYGAPVYEHDSLMSGRPRFRPPPALGPSCIDHVARRGGGAFFRRSGWRAELDRVVADWSARHGGRGAREEPEALDEAMVDDLRRARELIEGHLPGQSIRHLCLPYTIGSSQAVRAARLAGYRTCFWGVLADRKSNRPGQDPYRCPRLKSDYIFRLPGRGRRALSAILSEKLKRRLSGRPVY